MNSRRRGAPWRIAVAFAARLLPAIVIAPGPPAIAQTMPAATASLKIFALDAWSPALGDGPFPMQDIVAGSPINCGHTVYGEYGGNLVAGAPGGDEESFALAPDPLTPKPSPDSLGLASTMGDLVLQRFFVWQLSLTFNLGTQPGKIRLEQKCNAPPAEASVQNQSTSKLDPGNYTRCTFAELVDCGGIPQGALNQPGQYALSVVVSGPELGGIAPYMTSAATTFTANHR